MSAVTHFLTRFLEGLRPRRFPPLAGLAGMVLLAQGCSGARSGLEIPAGSLRIGITDEGMIGSFTDINNARRLKDKMLAWGKKAEISKFDRGDLIFFRVRVRAGTTLAEAERTEKVLNESGFPDTFVVAQ